MARSRKRPQSKARREKRGNGKKVKSDVQLKILTRMNRSYEIFKTMDMKRLTEIGRSNWCEKMLGDPEFESFRLSNTDKMALHKALKEKVIEEQQKQAEKEKDDGEESPE